MTSQELQYVEGLKMAVLKNINLAINNRNDASRMSKNLESARKKLDELEEKLKDEKL